MTSEEMRERAKGILRNLIPGSELDIDNLIDLIVEAAVAEIKEKYQVDVPNTGYFGVIVKKGK